MAKAKRKSNQIRQRQSIPRNATLDALRGLAILLMVVDHAAYFIFDVPIEPNTIRIFTRWSMPLFCGLMGYFMASKLPQGLGGLNWGRFLQLLAAAALVNVVFFPLVGKFEILASLAVCFLLFAAFRRWLCLAVVCVYLQPWDVLEYWFDYPLSVVVSCVAQGMVLRLYGWRFALMSGALVAGGIAVVTPPSVYVLYYVIPATVLIALGSQWPDIRAGWLQILGRFPLTAYVVHYFAVLWIGQQF